jgi:hypothetical protein
VGLCLREGAGDSHKAPAVVRGFWAVLRLASPAKCDVFITAEHLDWTAEHIAEEINRRKSGGPA